MAAGIFTIELDPNRGKGDGISSGRMKNAEEWNSAIDKYITKYLPGNNPIIVRLLTAEALKVKGKYDKEKPELFLININRIDLL